MSQIPTISARANLWVVIPIGALIVAIVTNNHLLLNYVHVFTSILWTGTDIFMALVLGPILRKVSVATRKELITWLMPKMLFYMIVVSSVTTTAGYYLAEQMGLVTFEAPIVYWMLVVLIIVAVMFVQGMGILMPTNLRIYFEMKKQDPDFEKIQRLTRRYVRVVAIQASMQLGIIFIMANFATGLTLFHN